ncbi:MAG: NADH-quinone oxidoreductase subunit J, partial [Thermodesulfovibrionales bacterium]
MIEKLLFGYITIAIIVLSVFVITRKNPVHSVVLMLVLFFHIALLYLTLNAEF